MEKKLRSELLELCHSIINDEREEDLVSTLTQTQMLYEKLVVLNFLQEQEENEEEENSNESDEQEEENTSEISHLSIEKSPQADRDKKIEPSSITEVPLEREEVKETISISPKSTESPSDSSANKNRSINDQMATGLLKIGLNDRIAFVKHLFNGEIQDYNRVLSNLNTMANYEEADLFVNQMIRPEYNWEGKDEYVDRLMDLIRLKFGIES